MITDTDLDFIGNLVYKNKKKNAVNWFTTSFCKLYNTLSPSSYLKITDDYINLMMTHEALINMYWLLSSTINDKIEGDIVELGCNDGLSSILMNLVTVKQHSDKKIYLFDSFEGLQHFSQSDFNTFLNKNDCMSSFEKLKNNFQAFSLPVPNVIVGDVKNTIPKSLPEKISFIHIDLDLYEPTLHSLEAIVPRLSKGAIVLLDDYNNPGIPGVKQALEDFFYNKRDVIVSSLYS